MKENRVLLIGGAVLAVVLIVMLATMDNADDAYKKQVSAERLRLQNAWSQPNFSKSPIPASQRRDLKLAYYEPDPDFRVDAKLQPDSSLKVARAAGWLTFRLKGETYRLIAQWEPQSGPRAIFVAFYDKTTGKTTYPGGRYLNLALKEGDKVPLDFNYAYNPYCEYNPEAYTTCPIPPQQNRLPIEITAGEKRYTKQ